MCKRCKQIHRTGYQFSDPLCPDEGNLFWNKFTKNDGEKSDQHYNYCSGNGIGIFFKKIYFFNVGNKIAAEFFTRIYPCKNSDQGDTYLCCRKKFFRVIGQVKCFPGSFISFSAWNSNLDLRAETRAISDITNKPFTKISKRRIKISI